MISRPPPTSLSDMEGIGSSLRDMGAIGTTLAGYAFFWGTISRLITLIPLVSLFRHLYAKLFPQVCITIPYGYSHAGYGHATTNELYSAVESYLSGAVSKRADNITATILKNSRAIAISLNKGEKVDDTFQGIYLEWTHCQQDTHDKKGSGSTSDWQERRWYSLKFLRRHRPLVLESYLRHILDRAREMEGKARQRRLYTNCPGSSWTNMAFHHPATFETVAMEPAKKKRIMDDLTIFSQSKDYYAKIGKAWKRGYLLHGPPGTGKSTLVAAMANFLRYDVYDLDLSAVRNNSSLRSLLSCTGSKSILVVEDIDCSLQLAGARRSKNMNTPFMEDSEDEEDQLGVTKRMSASEVTLSGLLNLIDGLWSVSQGERIIVFTTNHVDKLDPALIRRGRMDIHIHMSYCTFEGFKVLAKNYLGIDDHPLFKEIQELVEEVSITPADVAEQLMPKELEDSAKEKASASLRVLIDTMAKMKEIKH